MLRKNSNFAKHDCIYFFKPRQEGQHPELGFKEVIATWQTLSMRSSSDLGLFSSLGFSARNYLRLMWI